MTAEVFYIHGMAGTPLDWRAVQAKLPGIALPLESGASDPADCALRLANAVRKHTAGLFVLCGYSMGGRMALLAARELLARGRGPEALVLVSAGLGFGTEEERKERRRRDEAWAELAERSPEEFWKRWYEQDLFSSLQGLEPKKREEWLKNKTPPEILTAQLRNLGPGRHEDLFPLLGELHANGIRILYIHGELDKKYTELSRKVRGLKGLAVASIPGAGHILPLEAPDAMAERIARFLSGQTESQ
jgi:pimeloyl-ACP methyl ester carboxylesterase